MDVKMEVNLRNVQEKVSDNAQQVQTLGYRATMAYIGLWGLGYDFAKEMVESGKDLMDKAELRGEEMVRELNAQLDKASEQATGEAKKVVSMVNEQVDGVSSVVSDNTKTLEQEVEKVLAKVGFSRGEVTATVIEVAEDLEELAEPFTGYAEMTVKDILDKVDGMNEDELRSVRAYEAGTKKRVTVLRDIDERLAEPVTA